MYAKEASDHHKAWDFVIILLESCSLELLVPYIKSEKSPTVQGYYSWLSTNVNDETYKCIQQITWTFLTALYGFRCGVRRNNS